MKSLFHGSKQFPIDQSDGAELNYIIVEFASPNGFEFIKVKCLVDSGSTGSSITSELVERLGINDVLPYLGDQVAETANGTIREPTTAVHIRVTGSDGNATLFQDWPVTISSKMSEPIIGMDVIKFFSTQFKHGAVVHFVFDENSPGVIQKRRHT